MLYANPKKLLSMQNGNAYLGWQDTSAIPIANQSPENKLKLKRM